MLNKILIICIGNICRSPAAEILFKLTMKKYGESFEVQSAGLKAMVGEDIDSNIKRIFDENDIEYSSHNARQITVEMLIWADLILVMDDFQKKKIQAMDQTIRGKVFRLGNWGNYDIPDPYNKGLEETKASFRLIVQGVKDWNEQLSS